MNRAATRYLRAPIWAGRWRLTTPAGDALRGNSILAGTSAGTYILHIVVGTEQATT